MKTFKILQNGKNNHVISVFLPPGEGTDTVAVPQEDGSYRLYGYKWFTSATDADIAFTLARVQDPQGLVTPV